MYTNVNIFYSYMSYLLVHIGTAYIYFKKTKISKSKLNTSKNITIVICKVHGVRQSK